jgi:hypothetical protein
VQENRRIAIGISDENARAELLEEPPPAAFLVAKAEVGVRRNL